MPVVCRRSVPEGPVGPKDQQMGESMSTLPLPRRISYRRLYLNNMGSRPAIQSGDAAATNSWQHPNGYAVWYYYLNKQLCF